MHGNYFKREKKMLLNKVNEIVVSAVREVSMTLEMPVPFDKGEECPLYGNGGALDSISLVSLIVNVEQRIEDEFSLSIILANEKAMSQRHSPFLTIGSLSNYAVQLLEEARHE
jgi:D-alanine--poly(phosphoribitol) ligase subunit 2